VGGWLIEGPGWRWAFVVNVPLAVLVVIVTLRRVPESRNEQAGGRFDVAGAALAALALAGITYGLIGAAGGTGAGLAIAAGALGLVLGAVFILVERRRANPMLPMSVFASKQFSAINVVTLVVYAALGGFFFFLTLQLQLVSGFSPVAAGSALLPVTVLMLLLSSRAGALAQRIGPRWPIVGGTALAAAAVLLLARIGPDASYLTDVLPGAILFGLGISAVVAPLTATVLASADERQAGIASGVNNAVARTAQLLAVAGLPLVVGLSGSDYRSPGVFSDGYRTAMIICAGLLLAGAVLSLVTVSDQVLRQPTATRPDRHTYCVVDGTPLESHH
jgi:predicted MFS family arabinose efflux permease